jgi:mono/diheme cytochrome c family protein
MPPSFARLSTVVLGLVLACASTPSAFRQEPAGKPAVKMAPAKQTPVASGSIMFHEYCAACHGARGEGNGPAATALKKPPANLTLLAKQNNGTFPQKRVEDVLRHGVDYPSHGNSEMPVWGPTFRALSADQQAVTLRIANLTEYVRSLQAK